MNNSWYSKLLNAVFLLAGLTPSEEISFINKWGEQPDIDTADAVLGQKIWTIKAGTQQYIFIDSPIALNIRSSSANDTLLGSGAQKVKVQYQDIDGLEQEIVKDMAGASPVSIADSYGVFRMSIEQTGVGNTNAGTISIQDGSGNIYATIEVGEGQTQIAIYRIPNDKKGRVIEHEVGYGRTGVNNDAKMRLRVRKADGTVLTKHNPIVTTLAPKDIKKYLIGGIDLNPGEWVYWECIEVSANDTPIRASFDILLEDLTT